MLLLFGLALAGACAGTAPSAPTGRAAPADTSKGRAPSGPVEDLSKYRPVFAPPKDAAAPGAATPTATAGAAANSAAALAKAPAPVPANHVTAQVEQRLRDQAYANQNVKYASGYRVRAYLGLAREQVMTIRRQIIGRYPDETDYITFKQPVYRLYIGDYLTKLDAVRGLQRVRQFAPKAELEAMQVVLNKVP